MQEDKEIELLGGVNLKQLGKWLRISRNRVKEFMDEFGVAMVDKNYPWRRVIESVLAVAPNSVNANLTEKPLMTLAEAADELGKSSDDLKKKILNGSLRLPPTYVFGVKSRCFISSQLLEFSRNPRNEFIELPLRDELFLTVDDVAIAFEHPVSKLVHEFENSSREEPKHVILTGGEKRYFRADVQRFCLRGPLNKPDQRLNPEPVFSGGLLGAVAKSVAEQLPT